MRRGFTLTELLIAVGILLVLSSLTLVVFSNRNTDKTRSAARIAQSAFLGAKDRAMNAKDFRGVRLIRDEQNAMLVTGFAYTQPISHESYPSGSFTLERPSTDGVTASDSSVLIVRSVKTDWSFTSQYFATPNQIRLPAGSGQWYQFTVASPGVLQLAVPFTGPIKNPPPAVVANNSIAADIQFGNELLPFHQPIPLSSGVIIDLRYSSQNVQSMATQPAIDLLYSPRGTIGGAAGGAGAIYLCLRGLEDAVNGLEPSNPACQSECLILAINPSTGLVATYNADLTDADSDGKADNLFRFAMTGKGAGR